MKSKNIFPVILCGGNGTRLWPASRASHPKQFLNLLGEHTLLQSTISRANFLSSDRESIFVTSKDYRFLVHAQMASTDTSGSIICEPEAKDTCPSIVAAALEALTYSKSAILLILPSDHYIHDEESFSETIGRGTLLAQEDKLVVFGIPPNDSNTAYGYIKTGEPLVDAFTVDSFTEKPSRETAKKFLSEGSYLWNTGIFLFRASMFLSLVESYEPNLLKHVRLSFEDAKKNKPYLVLDSKTFSRCKSISIDYAIMEKANNAVVVPATFKWSDLGSWDALPKISGQDSEGNSVSGNIFMKDTSNSIIRSESRLVAALGIKNTVIIDTSDALLVSSKEHSQTLKNLVAELDNQGKKETKVGKVVHRPWGTFESIKSGPGYQAKHIVVYPGQSLSLQKHAHRAENWTVVRGVGSINLDQENFCLSVGQSILIPPDSIHRLANKTEEPLEIIEVQTGSYLGEDDIIRYDDIYGRVDNGT